MWIDIIPKNFLDTFCIYLGVISRTVVAFLADRSEMCHKNIFS